MNINLTIALLYQMSCELGYTQGRDGWRREIESLSGSDVKQVKICLIDFCEKKGRGGGRDKSH